MNLNSRKITYRKENVERLAPINEMDVDDSPSNDKLEDSNTYTGSGKGRSEPVSFDIYEYERTLMGSDDQESTPSSHIFSPKGNTSIN